MHMISVTFGSDFGNEMLEALYSAEEYGGKVTRFKALGGSGGNPDVDLEFPTREIAKSWLEEIYFHDDFCSEDIEMYLNMYHD